MNGKELIKELEKAGFTLAGVSGSHHKMVKGPIKLSVPVHGSKDVPVGTLNAILKQAGLK